MVQQRSSLVINALATPRLTIALRTKRKQSAQLALIDAPCWNIIPHHLGLPSPKAVSRRTVVAVSARAYFPQDRLPVTFTANYLVVRLQCAIKSQRISECMGDMHAINKNTLGSEGC